MSPGGCAPFAAAVDEAVADEADGGGGDDDDAIEVAEEAENCGVATEVPVPLRGD